MNIIAMRLGPGKHLKGRTLLGGVVAPEEFDYFHEVSCSLLTLGCPGLMLHLAYHQRRARAVRHAWIHGRPVRWGRDWPAASPLLWIAGVASQGRSRRLCWKEIHLSGDQRGIRGKRCCWYADVRIQRW